MVKKDKKSKITIIIPAYNEEKSIKNVIDDIHKKCSNIFKEIIVIDDGSTDNTANIAKKSGAKVIQHHRNKGYGAALKTGIKKSTTEYVLTMDSDGQHSADHVNKLWENADDFDMVIGKRNKIFHSSIWRIPGKWLLNLIVNYLVEYNIPDLNSGLRLIKRSVLMKYIHICPSGFSFSTTITMALINRGYDVKYLPIDVNKRIGKSTVKISTGFKTLLLIFRLITLFNPLKFFLPPSVISGVSGLAYSIFFMITEKRGLPPGGIFLIMMSLFLFVIGLLCDQISQLRLEKFE